MLRARLASVVMAAVVVSAAYGVTASAASAEVFVLTNTKCTGGTFINYCYENTAKEKLELTGNQTIGVNLVAATTWHIILPLIGAVLCQGAVFRESKYIQTSPLTANLRVGSFFIRWSQCRLDGIVEKQCKVPEEMESPALTGTPTSGSEFVVKPETGTTFAEIALENNGTETCPATAKGIHKVTGEQAFTVENPEVAEETKTIKSVVKSKLKVGEEAAELEAAFVISFTGLGDRVYVSTVA
jgi:hypothetical protein